MALLLDNRIHNPRMVDRQSALEFTQVSYQSTSSCIQVVYMNECGLMDKKLNTIYGRVNLPIRICRGLKTPKKIQKMALESICLSTFDVYICTYMYNSTSIVNKNRLQIWRRFSIGLNIFSLFVVCYVISSSLVNQFGKKYFT